MHSMQILVGRDDNCGSDPMADPRVPFPIVMMLGSILVVAALVYFACHLFQHCAWIEFVEEQSNREREKQSPEKRTSP